MLNAGTRLGPYEILSAIGAGGMGEVYQATDTNLKRAVAIKVLPAALAADADRLARFQREAEVLAALNHPHIAAIYGLERSGDTTALVMELVEGEDLSQRLARGAIPIDDALPIAKQIAEALEAAHEQGIIHRDLKPANIKVRPDGTVKVLDFGLAKAMDPAGGSSRDAMSSPTLSMHATQAGIILGTAAYMSPEQARGKAVDKRADVWAFGVVLYEMLSGRRAFEGDDISITLASVLKDDVKWEALPADLPAPMRRLLRRCLEKDPKRRLSAMADARLELDETASGVADVVPAPARAAVAGPVWRRALPWIVAAAMAGLSAIGWWPRQTVPHTSTKPVLRLALPFTETLDLSFGPRFVLSPDGSRLVYLAHGVDTTARLFLRSLDEDGSRPMPHTEGTKGGLAFSPDSRWIAFNSGSNAMEKILLDGGLPVPLAKGSGPHVTSWQSNHSLVFAKPRTGGANLGSLWRVPDTGGAAELIVDPDAAKDERAYYAPDVLPDGSILFVIDRSDSSAVAVLPHGKPPARILIEGARQARYAPSGYLIFAKLTTLMAASFDLEHLVVKSTPVPVLADVRTGSYRSSAFSLSATGTLVYLSSVMQPRSQLVLALVDRKTARETDLPFKPDTYAAAGFAPDGKAVVFAVQGRDGERTTSALWLGDLTRSTLTSLTNDGSRFAWTPDGEHIFFQPSNGGLAWRTRDLGGAQQALAGPEQVGGMIEGQPASSPDGSTLVFAAVRAHNRGSDLWMAGGLSGGSSTAGRVTIAPFLEEPDNQNSPTFSPDGRWVAYESSGGGAGIWVTGIYVRSFPGPGSVMHVASGSGPLRWVGKELFFVRARQVMAVSMTTSPSLGIGAPHAVWTLPAGATFADVTPDGQQLLLLKTVSDPAPEPPPHEFRVIINFVEEMKRKVAAGQ